MLGRKACSSPAGRTHHEVASHSGMVAEVHAAGGAGPRCDAGTWKAQGYVIDQRSVRGAPDM